MKMVNRLVEISEGDIRIDGRSVRSLDKVPPAQVARRFLRANDLL